MHSYLLLQDGGQQIILNRNQEKTAMTVYVAMYGVLGKRRKFALHIQLLIPFQTWVPLPCLMSLYDIVIVFTNSVFHVHLGGYDKCLPFVNKTTENDGPSQNGQAILHFSPAKLHKCSQPFLIMK